MEYAGVVPSVFLVFKGFALIAERLRVVDVEECSACTDWNDVVDVGAFAAASSAAGLELQAFGSNVVPLRLVFRSLAGVR